MIDFIRWMLAIEAIGIAVLPLIWVLFARSPTRGIACAKPFGILLIGCVAWLGPTLQLHPYTYNLLLVTSIGVVLLTWAAWGRLFITSLRQLSRGDLPLICAPELVFFGAALWQMFMVRLNPSMYLSEIPMNFAFVNAINRTGWLPPHDPWLAGYPINYYYFGHFLVAMLIRLIGSGPAVGFALAGITLFASVVALIFSLVVDIIVLQSGEQTQVGRPARRYPAVVSGCGAIVMALFNGNLVPLYQFVSQPAILFSWWANTVPDWWQQPYHSHGQLSELPWRTYLLHYTHSFDMALPFMLLLCVWSMAYWGLDRSPGHGGRQALFWASLSIVWGGTALISPWVLPVGGLLVAALLLKDLLPIVSNRTERRAALMKRVAMTLAGVAGSCAGSLILARLLAQHYYPAGQLSIELNPAGATTAISPGTFLLQFGVQLIGIVFVVAAYLIALRVPLLIVGVPVASILGALVFFSRLGVAAASFVLLWWLLLILMIWQARRQRNVPFSSIMLSVALTLQVFPFFISIHDQPNTFFKFGFLAWIVGSIAIFAALGTIWTTGLLRSRAIKRCVLGGIAATLFVGAWMPALAAMTTTNKLQGWGLQTLDGVDFYLQRTAPAEAEAVRWLNMRAADDAVILEATAQGFTAAGRIAAFTGLANVIGWYTHEALWHEGDTTALIDIGRRVSDVQRAYETLDPNEAQCLLQKYHVSYVVVGNVERESVQHIGIPQQRDAALTKFKRFMDVAYTASDDLRTSDVVIYQRRQNSDAVCSNPPSTISH